MKIFTFKTNNLSLLLIFFFLSPTSFAEKSTDIYKWVDEAGNTHYTARPGNDSAVKMNKISKRFSKKEKSTADVEAEKKIKMCQEAKATKKKYKSAPYLYRKDKENGQQIRLNEEESKKAFLQVEKDISYWCSPNSDTTESNKK